MVNRLRTSRKLRVIVEEILPRKRRRERNEE